MGLIICFNCGKEIDENEILCPHCGKLQETKSNSQPSIENHSPLCAECGKPVPSNSSFCPYCGFPLNMKNEGFFPQTTVESDLPANKKSVKRIIIGLVLFILASIFSTASIPNLSFSSGQPSPIQRPKPAAYAFFLFVL